VRAVQTRDRFDGGRIANWRAVPVVIAGGIPRPADAKDARLIAQALGKNAS